MYVFFTNCIHFFLNMVNFMLKIIEIYDPNNYTPFSSNNIEC